MARYGIGSTQDSMETIKLASFGTVEFFPPNLFENSHETPTFQTEPTAQRLITTPLAFEIQIGMINHKPGKDFCEQG
jgi:hypothetical protein